jgi:putative MFS transporter
LIGVACREDRRAQLLPQRPFDHDDPELLWILRHRRIRCRDFFRLFAGTFFLGFLADRFGRRVIFTFALLAYSAASVIMSLQTTPGGLLLWRFIAGIGVEIIAVDAEITELVPSRMRGRAFAVNRAVMFFAVPVIALLGWWLVPLSPVPGLRDWSIP